MKWMALSALLLFSAVASAQPTPSELNQISKFEDGLKFDDMYPRRPYTGKTASVQGWSHEDRYLAYLWNPYDTRGNDLYLYDARTKKSKRLTSLEFFAKFDRDTKKAIEFIKKDDERLKKWDGLSDSEWRQERQKFKEEQEKKTKPDPSYPGVSGIEWAHKSDEFIMTFRGDLYRWKVGSDEPVRLTQTREAETNPEYLPDDSGITYRRGSSVIKIKFGSDFVRQINPELPDGRQMDNYSFSPDGNNLLIFTSKSTGAERQVDYITYRGRLPEAKKTGRGIAEDDFKTESVVYFYDVSDKSLSNVDEDPKPFEIYRWPGGEEWYDLSTNEKPWSADGTRYVFASWKRDQKEFLIMEADLKTRSMRRIYRGTSDGEHGSPGLAKPFYSQDGTSVYVLLDKSGYRHLHKIDRISGADTQITKGDFEVYPLRLAADKKSILVKSSKDDPARSNLYRVDPATGDMVDLTKNKGVYGDPVTGNVSDKMATVFNSWTKLRELVVIDGDSETTLTDSHRSEAFWKVAKLKPQLVKFKNRHGDLISTYVFTPPNMDKSKKRPLFIYVYGGPLGTGKSVNDGSFGSTDFMFNQYLANTLGYVTITIDPRGSSGYNSRFGKSNFEHPGEGQTEDLVDAVKYFTAEYNIDTTKVGITGWSFGGFQTQHAMYNAPETFTLGIAGAGPTEWQNYNNWYTGGVIGNTPKGSTDYLDKFSLTKVAKNLKSPLLLLHGIEDLNVLYNDTVHVYQKLLQAGKGDLVELALDPTGSHGLGGDIDTRDRHAIYLAFILRRWGLVKY